MRSSRSGTDPLEPGPTGFAHRGVHLGASVPENSLAAFEAALEMGAGIECDLRLTADDQIIVFHDRDALRMCASAFKIGNSTLEQLSQLRLGEHPIPTLRNLLELVGGRVPLLLEIKVDRDVRRWLPAVARMLAGYRGALGIMSFDPRIARLLKANLPFVRRGLVVPGDLSPLRRRLAMWLADPQFIAVDQTLLGSSWVCRARDHIPIYAWTIRTAAQRAQAKVHADALIWESDGRPRI